MWHVPEGFQSRLDPPARPNFAPIRHIVERFLYTYRAAGRIFAAEQERTSHVVDDLRFPKTIH